MPADPAQRGQSNSSVSTALPKRTPVRAVQRCRPPPAPAHKCTQSPSQYRPSLGGLTTHHSPLTVTLCDEEVPIPTAAIFMTILANAVC